jgi:hypothetical protein
VLRVEQLRLKLHHLEALASMLERNSALDVMQLNSCNTPYGGGYLDDDEYDSESESELEEERIQALLGQIKNVLDTGRNQALHVLKMPGYKFNYYRTPEVEQRGAYWRKENAHLAYL